MILCLGDFLPADQTAALAARFTEADFADGAATAGWHAREVKRNQQALAGPALRSAQLLFAQALESHVLAQIALRPRVVRPAMVNRHAPGMAYGPHVDDAVMGAPPMRADVALTLFLSSPEAYDGGELVIETTAGEQPYKLAAGSLLLYPASTLHRVAPVTRGARLAVVSWAQSLLRDPAQRELLFELDQARRALFEREGKSREFDLLSRSLANLLRMWAET